MHRNRPIQKYAPQEYFLFLRRRSTLISMVHLFQAGESLLIFFKVCVFKLCLKSLLSISITNTWSSRLHFRLYIYSLSNNTQDFRILFLLS